MPNTFPRIYIYIYDSNYINGKSLDVPNDPIYTEKLREYIEQFIAKYLYIVPDSREKR